MYELFEGVAKVLNLNLVTATFEVVLTDRRLPLTLATILLPAVTPRELKKLFTVTLLVSIEEVLAGLSTTRSRSSPATLNAAVNSLTFVVIYYDVTVNSASAELAE